jgi:hypothetical protein
MFFPRPLMSYPQFVAFFLQIRIFTYTSFNTYNLEVGIIRANQDGTHSARMMARTVPIDKRFSIDYIVSR